MVTKRELAAAQQALNEVVGGFVHDYGYMSQHWPLRDAYNEWDALRKQLDGQGPAVARSTSIAAAKANIMHKQSLRRTILSMVVNHYRHFHTGMTTDEIQGRLRGKHQSVSARVSELLNTFELLVDSGKKRETSSGKQATVWEPTDEAIKLVLVAETNGAAW